LEVLTSRKKAEDEMIEYHEKCLGVKLNFFDNIETRRETKVKGSDMVSRP